MESNQLKFNNRTENTLHELIQFAISTSKPLRNWRKDNQLIRLSDMVNWIRQWGSIRAFQNATTKLNDFTVDAYERDYFEDLFQKSKHVKLSLAKMYDGLLDLEIDIFLEILKKNVVSPNDAIHSNEMALPVQTFLNSRLYKLARVLIDYEIFCYRTIWWCVDGFDNQRLLEDIDVASKFKKEKLMLASIFGDYANLSFLEFEYSKLISWKLRKKATPFYSGRNPGYRMDDLESRIHYYIVKYDCLKTSHGTSLGEFSGVLEAAFTESPKALIEKFGDEVCIPVSRNYQLY